MESITGSVVTSFDCAGARGADATPEILSIVMASNFGGAPALNWISRAVSGTFQSPIGSVVMVTVDRFPPDLTTTKETLGSDETMER